MSVILATGGYDHKIRFWEAPSGFCSRTLRFADSQINCLEITPDKQFLAAGGGQPIVRLYDIENTSNDNPVMTCHTATTTTSSNNNNNQVTHHQGSSAITALGFQREGRWMYTSSEDGTVKIFDLRSPNYQRSFDCKAACNSVALHPNQAQLMTGDANGRVKVFDLSTSKCINDFLPDGPSYLPNPIQSVDISNDGAFAVAVSNRGRVFAWNTAADNHNNDNYTSSATTSMSEFKPIIKFQANPPGSYCLHAKISPDCRSFVTTSSDKTARLWDTSSWELSSELSKHSRWVWDAAFSADSSYLVTASSDHTARLWSLRGGGEVVREYTDHQSAVTCVALNDSSP